MADFQEPVLPYLVNYRQYLNIPHDYKTNNCISLIANFYDKELKIPFEEERVLFNNFSITSIKELRSIPIESIYALKNWTKISLTEIQEFDIIIYTRNSKLSHFAMYMGEYKILDVKEGQTSKLSYLNDTQRNNIEGIMRHKLMDPKIYRIAL
jgi:hypothetical protein